MRHVELTAWVGLLSCTACQHDKAHTSDAPQPSASVLAAAPSVAAVKAADKPWFTGTFSGSYQSELAALKSEVGAPRQWQKDDGKTAVGPGTLTLSIAEDGAVAGSAQGAFGKETLNGKVEGDVVRAMLLANGDNAFRGTLVAAREGDGFKGSIQASSADSNMVRAAAIELTRKP